MGSLSSSEKEPERENDMMMIAEREMYVTFSDFLLITLRVTSVSTSVFPHLVIPAFV